MSFRSTVFGLLLAACFLPAVPAADPAGPPPKPEPRASASERSDPSAPTVPAAPIDPNDLGLGLRYFRSTALATDLSALEAALSAGPLVLDLRAAQGDAVSTARLQRLLQRHAAIDAGLALFVLLGTDTPDAVRAAVPTGRPVITLGCAGPGFAPAVAVSTDLARDRAAVAALASGRLVRELVAEKLDKPRYDEARLALNRANGHRDADDGALPPSDTKDKPATATAPAAEAPLQDLVLQRALFLHRALLALGRLPQKD